MRSSQAGHLLIGHGSAPRTSEEGVLREGVLWGNPSPWPVRGHKVDGQYPQHPRVSELLGPIGRSGGGRSRGREPFAGYGGVPTKSRGAASTVWGEES